MENIIFLIFLFSFCLGQLGRFSLFRPDLVIHINDIVIGIVIISYFLIKILKKEKIYLPKIFKPVVFFFLIGIVSLLVNFKNFNLNDVGVGSLYLIRLMIYAMLPVFIFNWCKKEKNCQEKVLRFLLLGGTITAVLGLFQYISFPDLRPFEEYDWDPHLYRLVGTFFDPGFIGGILVLTLIILFLMEKKSGFYYFSLFLTYLAMILTYSRTTYLAYLVSIFLISIIKKSKKFFIITFLIFVLSLQLVPKGKSYGTKIKRQETAWARLENIKTAFKIFKKYPFFGVGFNNYRYAQIKHGFLEKKKAFLTHAGAGSDNSYLFILATTGIFGFSTFAWIFLKLSKEFNFTKLLNGREKNLNKKIVFVSILAVFTQSLFLNSLFYPFIMEWLWLLVGLSESTKEKI